MFASTAYEAYYAYIGIYLHEASIKIITSQEVLVGLLALILGYCVLMGTWRYCSTYLPIFATSRKVGVSFIFKIIACFLLGVSLLKVEAPEGVKNYNRKSWHKNPYISSRMPGINPTYKVSLIFDLFTRSAEEIAKFATGIVDGLFAKTNSQLDAPSAFYKAVLFAGSQTIDDPRLKDEIDAYTNSCFDKILPLLGQAKQEDRIDQFFKGHSVVDKELERIPIEISEGKTISCLELKEQVRKHLWEYAQEKETKFGKFYSGKLHLHRNEYNSVTERNLIASSALVNYFLSKSEDTLGTQEGSKVQGTFAKFLLGWNRFWSFDGFLTLIGEEKQVGAALTAERATKFSEYLQRAPHLKGLVQLFLIVIFPWLVFFVVAGRWRLLISWFALYCSVLLWTPIWCLLYHLMMSIALSTELMGEFGRISDGISLYSSSFITTRLYQFYAIYSWFQLFVGPLPTLMLGYGLFSSMLKDSEGEQAPPVVTTVKDVGIGAATGGVGGAAGAVIRKV